MEKLPSDDKEKYAEIEILTEREGWEFGGNSFAAEDQRYHIILKKGSDEKEFIVTLPYPKIFDSEGKAKNIF